MYKSGCLRSLEKWLRPCVWGAWGKLTVRRELKTSVFFPRLYCPWGQTLHPFMLSVVSLVPGSLWSPSNSLLSIFCAFKLIPIAIQFSNESKTEKKTIIRMSGILGEVPTIQTYAIFLPVTPSSIQKQEGWSPSVWGSHLSCRGAAGEDSVSFLSWHHVKIGSRISNLGLHI